MHINRRLIHLATVKSRLGFTTGIGIVATAAVLFVTAPDSTHGEQRVPELCKSDHFSNLRGRARPSECCKLGNQAWSKITTPTRQTLRYQTFSAGPCREADGEGTNCGIGSYPFVRCAFGPCGQQTEWVLRADEIHIFAPNTKPLVCGWVAENISDCGSMEEPDGECKVGSNRHFPEPYIDQPVYDGVMPSCPYNQCAIGGRPMVIGWGQ